MIPLNQVYQRAVNAYTATYETFATANQRVTAYATNSFATLQQQGINAKESIKNTFTRIHEHPLTPYVSAGLFGMAAGSLIGLPLTTSLVLGVSAKLVEEGLDYGLESINNAARKAFCYLGHANDVEIPATWKQTATIVPIALGSFALGLHAKTLLLAAKLSSILAVTIIGSFTLGSTLRA